MRPSFASAANVVAALGVGRLGDIRFIRPALQSADRQTRSPGCTVKGMKFTNTIITASGAGHCDGCTCQDGGDGAPPQPPPSGTHRPPTPSKAFNAKAIACM